MKTIRAIIDTLLFLVALILFFIWIYFAYLLYLDATPRGLIGLSAISQYSPEETVYSNVGFVLPITLSVLLFVLFLKRSFIRMMCSSFHGNE